MQNGPKGAYLIDPQIGQFWLGMGFWPSRTELCASVRTIWSLYTNSKDKGVEPRGGMGKNASYRCPIMDLSGLYDQHLITPLNIGAVVKC